MESVCFAGLSGVTFVLPVAWTGGKRKGKSLTFWFVLRGLTIRSRVLLPKMGMGGLWLRAKAKFGMPSRRYLHLLTASPSIRA